jgi:manganese-dependent ADP-ribose/CDP-alcohol diphosphatase
MSPSSSQPLFAFGCIADAQYADLPDGNTEGRIQRYCEVPEKLAAALTALRQRHPPLAFVLHLGDIVNGNPAGQAACDAEFEHIAAIFDKELVGFA